MTVSRWGFAATGNAIHMTLRFAGIPTVAVVSGYGTNFFSLSAAVAAAVLVGFTASLLLYRCDPACS